MLKKSRREAETTSRVPDHGRAAAFRWLVGVAVPLAIVAYGISVVATRHATLGRYGNLTLTGRNAIAIGVAWIAVGVFVHFNYFWGERSDGRGWVEIGKIAGLVGAVGGLGLVLVRLGVFNLR